MNETNDARPEIISLIIYPTKGVLKPISDAIAVTLAEVDQPVCGLWRI